MEGSETVTWLETLEFNCKALFTCLSCDDWRGKSLHAQKLGKEWTNIAAGLFISGTEQLSLDVLHSPIIHLCST